MIKEEVLNLNDENLEKSLKEFLLNMWKNNPVFRDNIAYLTQIQLRFPHKFILEMMERVEYTYYHELIGKNTPPPIPFFIYWTMRKL